MAFDESVLIVMEGNIVVPISHVTGAYTTEDIAVYDGQTYRDDVSNGGVNEEGHILQLWENTETGSPGTAGDLTNPPTGDLADGILIQNTTDASGASEVNTKAYYALSDSASHTPPRFLSKKRTLWKFPRTLSGAAAFTHVVWADLVQATCSHSPWRIGMSPTDLTS